ncbi:hypothetical protein CERSUDRAFT_109304 [Gelatoporia subvermispora B]|uniref:Uncharacterized protein n=1 Tax=Ceriporiopsis subvermispora (strain B) TaxID=914234 RepID=M2QZY9_CERS8|nr:hypothetical protein CERSUDRAFT_109304 [Gelatoporia subvermispora B]
MTGVHLVHVIIALLVGSVSGFVGLPSGHQSHYAPRQDVTDGGGLLPTLAPVVPATPVAPAVPPDPSPVVSSAPAVLASPTPAPAVSSVSPVTPITSSTDPVVTPSSIIAPPSAVSSTQASAPSPPSSAPLIHITALPPASKSSNDQNTIHTSSGFKIVYLAPVFAVIGAVVGSLLAWLFYRLVTRDSRRRARENILQAGPRYVPPPENIAEGVHVHPSYAQLNAFQTPSKQSSYGATATHQQSRGPRMDLAKSTSAHFPVQPPVSVPSTSSKGSSNRSSFDPRSSGEDVPFLAPNASSRASTPLRPQPSGQSATHLAQARSPEPPSLFGDGDDDNIPYELLRHTSIRRNILDRLKLGSMHRAGSSSQPSPVHSTRDNGNQPLRRASRRHGHRRRDSDLTIDQLTASSQANMTPSRAPSIVRDYAETPTSYSGTGFRIVVEDPEADSRAAQQAEESQARRWNVGWPPSPIKRAAVDKYTPLPPRRSADRRSGSQAPAARTSSPALSRVDSSVLPSSPPTIMSPPLESQLFFGPAVSPPISTGPSVGTPGVQSVSRSAKPVREDPNAKQTKKLQKEPPLLPLPSAPRSSPHRTRLEKPQPSKALLVEPRGAGIHLQPSSSGSSSGQAGARLTAHDRVNQIIAQSWSQRDMGTDHVKSTPRGDRVPLVPTDVMDNPRVREAIAGTGIEQRLEAFRARETMTGHRN